MNSEEGSRVTPFQFIHKIYICFNNNILSPSVPFFFQQNVFYPIHYLLYFVYCERIGNWESQKYLLFCRKLKLDIMICHSENWTQFFNPIDMGDFAD